MQPAAQADATTAPRQELRLLRPDNPYVALGLAVSHLMTKPAFAALRFGEWSRILVGQINRKHFYFVVDGKNEIHGFLGWALCTQEKGEAWLAGQGALTFQDSLNGDCIVFNAWAASSRAVNRALLEAARKVMVGKEFVYFKRYYKDGSTRPMRLRVNDFVAPHIEKAGNTA
jgi:hemolysin-activating ACP:hemolysin acyltransferase